MEPNNHLLQSSNEKVPDYVAREMKSSGDSIEANDVDIITTLRNLATANASNNSYLHNTTLPNEFYSNSWSNSSNNWLDQAKLSLLPMYGLLQTSANNSEFSNNVTFPFLVDQNLQQAAIAAASLNVMENIQSFGHHYETNSNFSVSNVQSHQTLFNDDHPLTSMQTYSHPTSNLSQTSKSSNQSQIAVSPMDGQTRDGNKPSYLPKNNTFGESIEELTDFDLEDFQDILLDRNTFTHSKPIDNAYSHTVQTEAVRNSDVKINEQCSISFRHDEFTKADKELDRLVSLVADQNKHIDKKSGDFKPLQDFTHNSCSLSAQGEGELLHTLQFTPPDSPILPTQSNHVHRLSNDVHASELDNEIANSLINIKMQPTIIPKTSAFASTSEQKEHNEIDIVRLNRLASNRIKNNNKVPIYKQNLNVLLHSNICNVNVKTESMSNSTSTADAYSFEDELDEKPLLTTSNFLKEQKSQPINEKILLEAQANNQKKRKYTKRTDGTSLNVLLSETEARKEQNKKMASLLVERIGTRQIKESIFITEVLSDNNVVISDVPMATCTLTNEINECKTSDNICQKLPKLIIRIPKQDSNKIIMNTPENVEELHKKQKKKKNRDIDWTKTDECRFIKRKKHKDKRKRRSHKKHDKKNNSYREEYIEEVATCLKLLDSSNEQKELQAHTVIDRLHCFEKPTERPKKGTFLLSKMDLFSDKCALWKIDNQNLLQKYMPFSLDGTIYYKNSQTYSGWCEDYAQNFFALKVDYFKQSRSENIVKPILPLHDLFPAINLFANNESLACKEKHEKNNELVNDQYNHLTAFVKIMLIHCIALDFIQELRQNNDLNYLCVINELETTINNCIVRIRTKSHWLQPLVDALNSFSQLFLIDLDNELDMEQSCQACLRKSLNVKQVVQLYSNEIMDCETFLPIENNNNSLQSSTIDFYVCKQCADLIQKYHKVYHLRLTIFKNCEKKIESVIVEHPGLSTNQIEEHCIADRFWLNEQCKVILNALQI